MSHRYCRSIAFMGLAAIASAMFLNAQSVEQLTEQQMKDFLLNAKVVNSKQSNKGITRPYKLTLNNGTLAHDASFQVVEESSPNRQFDNGRREMNFRDSYKYSIAAYELAKLLGLGDMMPVTVERRWEGKIGALSWWLPSKMDEGERLEKHLEPPDREAWNKQMHKMRVFAQLVYDTDRNGTNVLISEDWHIWMIDFSRAFRFYTTLENPKNLTRCDRRLLEKLRKLDAAEVAEKTKGRLGVMEIKGIMARRDKIVALFDDLVAKKGEAAVIYDSTPTAEN